MNWVNWRMLPVRDIAARASMGNYWLRLWGTNEGLLCLCEKVMRLSSLIGKRGGGEARPPPCQCRALMLHGRVGRYQVGIGWLRPPGKTTLNGVLDIS